MLRPHDLTLPFVARAAGTGRRFPPAALLCARLMLGLAGGAAGTLGAPAPVWPAPAPEEREEPAGARAPHRIGSALFVGEVGVELQGRWFAYSDGITQNLRPYSVFGAPTVSIAGEVYPMAGSPIPWIGDLGLTLSYARALGLDSATEGGDAIGTTSQRLGVGLRGRRVLGEGAAPILGLSAGFRLVEFSFDAPEDLAAEVPDVSYALLRLGVDGRVPLGPVAVAAMLEYLGPLSAGDVYERFKDPTVAGIGLGVGVIYPTVIEGVEARLWVEYSRFFSAFSPDPGDPYVAGGALDELLGLRLSGAYIH